MVHERFDESPVGSNGGFQGFFADRRVAALVTAFVTPFIPASFYNAIACLTAVGQSYERRFDRNSDMNPNAIREISLYGRFRIPFPDTSYALRERRHPTAAGNKAKASEGVSDSHDAADTAEAADTSTLIPHAALPDMPDRPDVPKAPVEDRRSLRCFVTAHVVASIENLCASELVAHINSAAESVVGSEVLLKHNHAAAVGSMVAVTGHVSIVEDRSVTFEVRAKVDGLVVAEGQLRFVIVERDRFAARRIESIVERGLSMIQGLNSHAPDVGTPHPVSGRSDAQFAAGCAQRTSAG